MLQAKAGGKNSPLTPLHVHRSSQYNSTEGSTSTSCTTRPCTVLMLHACGDLTAVADGPMAGLVMRVSEQNSESFDQLLFLTENFA